MTSSSPASHPLPAQAAEDAEASNYNEMMQSMAFNLLSDLYNSGGLKDE